MRREIAFFVAASLAALLPGLAAAQETASGVKDFRGYVFGAYTAAFIVLFGLLAVILVKQRRITEEVEELRERVAKTAGAG